MMIHESLFAADEYAKLTIYHGSRRGQVGIVIARLVTSGLHYRGEGTTIAAALKDLDHDIYTLSSDCDCVLDQECQFCCPREMVSSEISF